MSGAVSTLFWPMAVASAPVVGARELLPLPLFEVECASPHLSRPCRQRIQRRAAVQRRCNETIHSVNWLLGHSVPSSEVASSSQRAAMEHIKSRAEAIGEPVEHSKAAISALLRRTAGYGQDGALEVSVFKPGHVSLPADVSGCPLVRELLPCGARDLFEDIESLLRPEDELLQMEDRVGSKFYFDQRLAGDEELYGSF